MCRVRRQRRVQLCFRRNKQVPPPIHPFSSLGKEFPARVYGRFTALHSNVQDIAVVAVYGIAVYLFVGYETALLRCYGLVHFESQTHAFSYLSFVLDDLELNSVYRFFCAGQFGDYIEVCCSPATFPLAAMPAFVRVWKRPYIAESAVFSLMWSFRPLLSSVLISVRCLL